MEEMDQWESKGNLPLLMGESKKGYLCKTVESCGSWRAGLGKSYTPIFPIAIVWERQYASPELLPYASLCLEEHILVVSALGN